MLLLTAEKKEGKAEEHDVLKKQNIFHCLVCDCVCIYIWSFNTVFRVTFAMSTQLCVDLSQKALIAY